MGEEVDYERRTLSYAEARDRFDDPNRLLTLLKEGEVVATGRAGFFSEDPRERPSAPIEIDRIVWQDWEIDEKDNLLRDDIFHTFYAEIEIPKEGLKSSKNEPPTETAIVNRGGRLPNPLWIKFWIEIVMYVHEDGFPESTAAFALIAYDFDLWEGDPPDIRTIEKRLEPLMGRFRDGGET